MTPPDVCGLAEAAELLGISRERVRQLRNARQLPDAKQLDSGPVWDRPELLAFHLDRHAANADDARLGHGHAIALDAWREHRTIAATARAAGISRATARRWLKQLGISTTREDTMPVSGRSSVTKIRAGLYRHESGRLIKHTTGTYEGPRGGNVDGWEHAREDASGVVIDGWTVYPTLREAVADLERLLSEDHEPIKPVPAKSREAWEAQRSGYTREQFEADRNRGLL